MPRREVPVLDSTRQLFVLDDLLESTRGLQRRQHALRKHPRNPVLHADRSWEGATVSLHGSVCHEPKGGQLLMWYWAGKWDEQEVGESAVNMHLATGLDGLNWEKPDLYVHEWHGQPANNIVHRPHFYLPGKLASFGAVALIHDPHDPDPMRRYKMMCNQKNFPDELGDADYPSGHYATFSPDGIHWREHPEPCFRMADGIGDTMSVMHDPRNKRYIAFVKLGCCVWGRRVEFRRGPGGEFQTWFRGRRVGKQFGLPAKRMRGLSVSEDFVHWSDPEFIIPPDDDDPPDAQFYQNTGFPYESMYLGFNNVYHPNVTGTMDLQLIWSRDGLEWDRTFDRTPVLPVGRDQCDWDCGCHTAAANPPIKMGDELWFYYSSGPYRHTGGKIKAYRPTLFTRAIGVATLRLDGFVSLDGGNRTGRATLAPMRFAHDALCVNADASAGEVRAQLTCRGRVLPGFDLKSCVPLRHDTTRHVFRFKGGAIPADKGPIRVELSLRNASVYAWWCEPAPPVGSGEGRA